MKSKPVPVPKKRYEPRPVPVNSFALSKSPLCNTRHAKVMRFHNYQGVPTLFLVVDRNGRELCSRFPYEPDALAHCKALEEERLRFPEEWEQRAVFCE
jgi:hypothetical protein